jgi:hypothetical protein
VCASCFADSAARLAQDLEEAKAKYVPRARWSPKGLAEYLIATVQGAIILAKAKQDPSVMRETLGHSREYLKCLFGK